VTDTFRTKQILKKSSNFIVVILLLLLFVGFDATSWRNFYWIFLV